jgi:uncharacterized Zn finger protein (UPF0148 family)
MAGRPTTQTTRIACASCGAPLDPSAGVRIACPYCGTVNDVASKGAVQVANRLEQLGVRVPERPMSISDIEAELAERAAAERERRRTAILVAGVAGVLFTLVLAAILIAASI